MTILTESVDSYQDIIQELSIMQKLARTVEYCHRFYHNVAKSPGTHGSLKIHEIQSATITITEIVQTHGYAVNIENITSRNSRYEGRLRALNSLHDEMGLLPVGGRFAHATITADIKHPIILPTNNYITKSKRNHNISIIFMHPQKQPLTPYDKHSGQTTAYNGWKSNSSSKPCFRTKPILHTHQIGYLSSERESLERLFLVTSIDFCGPFSLRRKSKDNEA